MKYSSFSVLFLAAGCLALACGGGPDGADNTEGTGDSDESGSLPGSGGSDSPSATGGSNTTNSGGQASGSGGQTGGSESENGSGGSEGGSGGAGLASGGAPSTGGGPQSCEQADPPENVSAWINESWDAQLGDNINSRQAWLLDNVMMGEGQINLCVRWGATSAPSATVKSQLASSVQGWFNDWFKALGDYDCFPFGDGIETKITGWAVKPGNESWVSDLGSEVAVYTELDGEGEPKCPDACSFFSHWDHSFSACSGGQAFHTDYWIWVDDTLPEAGAAAVGGDWGLRMPVSTLVSRLGQSGDNIIEHEMGHGFGFQDYYDWTGSRPEGGSLMIVGSQAGGVPTTGDTWLLRRTWSEMRVLRGW